MPPQRYSEQREMEALVLPAAVGEHPVLFIQSSMTYAGLWASAGFVCAGELVGLKVAAFLVFFLSPFVS